jgi:hypothetical protein
MVDFPTPLAPMRFVTVSCSTSASGSGSRCLGLGICTIDFERIIHMASTERERERKCHPPVGQFEVALGGLSSDARKTVDHPG